MSRKNVEFGACSEELALNFLKASGFEIITRNLRTRFGEIDIIARENNTLCFIEVKGRSTANFGNPKEAVDSLKRRRLSKSALAYLKDHKLLDASARFDVVSIEYETDAPRIELIRNAFELDGRYGY